MNRLIIPILLFSIFSCTENSVPEQHLESDLSLLVTLSDDSRDNLGRFMANDPERTLFFYRSSFGISRNILQSDSLDKYQLVKLFGEELDKIQLYLNTHTEINHNLSFDIFTETEEKIESLSRNKVLVNLYGTLTLLNTELIAIHSHFGITVDSLSNEIREFGADSLKVIPITYNATKFCLVYFDTLQKQYLREHIVISKEEFMKSDSIKLGIMDGWGKWRETWIKHGITTVAVAQPLLKTNSQPK